MNVDDLPRVASVFPGESICSWLEGTRCRLGLPEQEWWQWCECSLAEPERKANNRNWGRLPEGLGDISEIPAAWRLGVSWRRLACPDCRVIEAEGERYPVLVDWLDARAFACREHRRILCYFREMDSIEISANDDLTALFNWIEDWRNERIEIREGQLRRDLVIASGRNWAHGFDGVASVGLAWTLEAMGWQLPKMHRSYPSRGPSRFGQLAPRDRSAALFGAYRAWRALMLEDASSLPDWPISAWSWLEHRWSRRDYCRISSKIAGVRLALSSIRRR